MSSGLRLPSPPGLLAHRQFFAMNTTVRVFAAEQVPVDLLERAESVFHRIERTFSRFRPDSELSRLNAASGNEVAVSPEMFRLLQLCLAYHDRTNGLFEPAILPNLEACGYDRSFELVPQHQHASVMPGPEARRSLRDVKMDSIDLLVRTPRAMRLDFGGIGKGYAVDEAAQLLRPAEDFLIDAGGDISASGDGPDGDGWTVSIADALVEGRERSIIDLRNQALATSATTRRSWIRGAVTHHHIIDPRTGRPAHTDVLAASVIAQSATEADVYAKPALLLGAEKALTFLASLGVEGLLQTHNGRAITTTGWPGGVA